MNFLSVKAVPTVSWSSRGPLNFRPEAKTVFLLCLGLILFGIGEALLIAAGAGVSPWVVFAEGISLVTGLNIGWANFLVSIGVLLLWIPLRQTPGLGTILNAILVSAAITISACAGFVAVPANPIRRGRASCWDGKRFLPNS